MSDEPINLVLEHLRAIRGEIVGLREDVREIKHRQIENNRQMLGLRRDQVGDAEMVARVEARLDHFGDRLERVETRLSLRDT